MNDRPEPLRIGQFSSYFGERDGMAELIATGVDVLAGDYLAELTMMVLQKNRDRGGVGYAGAFIDQLGKNLSDIAEAGIKVITNAGGLDPLGCAEAVRALCQQAGVELRVAAISGDDVRLHLTRFAGEGRLLQNLQDGTLLNLDQQSVLTANAYLGAWPIVSALRDADIVICPRVTDASLVIGPAAWHFGWQHDDWDRLSGALWAGHVIECSAQATGGNFSFFDRFPSLGIPGMPIAEVFEDGASIITKADNTGGVVTVDTVKAQLVYEVGSARYDNPDVVGDLSSLQVEQVGPDRVRLSGARGFAPTESTKVSLAIHGGYRNSFTVGITGVHLEEKLAWLKSAVHQQIGSEERFEVCRWTVIGPRSTSAGSLDDATAFVIITVRDPDREKVSRKNFADPIVGIGVASIPGWFAPSPPQHERSVAVQWPFLIEKKELVVKVHLKDKVTEIPWFDPDEQEPEFVASNTDLFSRSEPGRLALAELEPTILGKLFGVRSGDKGSTANVGIWATSDLGFEWLHEYLTVARLSQLLPELEGFSITRHVFANIQALNFEVRGWLDSGASANTRVDPMGKGLGEYLGSRIVHVPATLLATVPVQHQQ